MKKRPGDSPAHLRLIRQLPCCVCGNHPSDPHHLKRGVSTTPTGVGRKNEDRWAVPLCRACHEAAHRHGNDQDWLWLKRVDGIALAKDLWLNTGHFGLMEESVLGHGTRRQAGAISGADVRPD